MSQPGPAVVAAESTWNVELQVVIYLEPGDVQAHNLAARLREDESIARTAAWERTPGVLGGADEHRAMTLRCLVSARTEDGARLIAGRALADAVEALILDDPPGLLAPVMTDVGEVLPASSAEVVARSRERARAC